MPFSVEEITSSASFYSEAIHFGPASFRTFHLDKRTYSGPGELQLKIIRLDAQDYRIIFDSCNRAHNTAGGHDLVAILEFLQHLSLLLLLPLHRHEQKKIEDDAYQKIRREERDRVRSVLLQE